MTRKKKFLEEALKEAVTGSSVRSDVVESRLKAEEESRLFGFRGGDVSLEVRDGHVVLKVFDQKGSTVEAWLSSKTATYLGDLLKVHAKSMKS